LSVPKTGRISLHIFVAAPHLNSTGSSAAAGTIVVDKEDDDHVSLEIGGKDRSPNMNSANRFRQGIIHKEAAAFSGLNAIVPPAGGSIAQRLQEQGHSMPVIQYHGPDFEYDLARSGCKTAVWSKRVISRPK